MNAWDVIKEPKELIICTTLPVSIATVYNLHGKFARSNSFIYWNSGEADLKKWTWGGRS